MDLNLSSEDQFLAGTVREFVKRSARTEHLVDLQTSPIGFDPAWMTVMAEAGWSGLGIADSDGGVGASALQLAVVAEELGRGPVPGPFLGSSVVAASLLSAAKASDARSEMLSGIADGTATIIPTFGPGHATWGGLISEREFLSSSGDTAAGSFPFVPYATGATHFLVPLRRHADGVDLGIVRAGDGGVRIRPLGGFLAYTSEVTMQGARVESAHRISVDARADALLRSYTVIAAYLVGGCQSLLERSVDYSNTRVQFGRLIGTFQRVQDHVVEIVNALDTARWMTYEALWRVDAGHPAATSVHRAKAVATESYVTCADAAHKLHGGIGVDPSFGITLHTRQSRTLFHLLGDARWHKRAMLDSFAPAST